MRKCSIWLILLPLLLACSGPGQEAPPAEKALLHRTTGVTGMTCQGCVQSIQNAVGALEGVQSVKVDLAAESMDVVYDGGAVTFETICGAVEKAGYAVGKAAPVEKPDPVSD